MNRKPIPICVVLSESEVRQGVVMMYGVQTYQMIPEPLKTPPRPFKEHEGKTLEMYLKKVKHLSAENKRLHEENSEVNEAYRTLNKEYKILKEKYMQKLAN